MVIQTTSNVKIEHEAPIASQPAYINQAYNQGFTAYYLMKSVVDALNDHARLPVFSSYRQAADKVNPFFANDASEVKHAPTATEIADARVLETLLTPAVREFAASHHITFAKAAADVGTAIDTLVAYNRVDGDRVADLGQFEGLLSGNGADLEDQRPAAHYTQSYASHGSGAPTAGQSVLLIGAIFDTAWQVDGGFGWINT